LPLLKFQPS